jgi:mannose-1-phosphate guanylyltransferase
MGGRPLIEETWRRHQPRHLRLSTAWLVVTARHEPYYTPLLARLGPTHVVVQPENRGTAAGILYPMLRLWSLAPAATVAVLPSDHHYSDDMASWPAWRRHSTRWPRAVSASCC